MLSAFPNPIGDRGTSLRLVMPSAGPARVAIWDVGGRLIRELYDGTLPPGAHDFAWNRRDDRGRTVPAGIYWLRVRAMGSDRSERLVALR